MPPTNLGFMESLNTYLPYLGMVVVAIVAVVIFVWYTKKYTPEIARTCIKAHHSSGLPVFVQNEMGIVELQICDKKFPEGIVHTKRSGWFLLPSPPNPNETEDEDNAKRGPGRPAKDCYKSSDDLAKMSEDEKEKYIKAYGILIQAPILKGLGKQVFFGSSVAAALSNLTAIAHADLLEVRKLAPKMYQKTQLDALATGNRLEGLKMAGKDMTKWIFAAIAGAIIIGALGLVVYLLTQHNTAALAFLGVM